MAQIGARSSVAVHSIGKFKTIAQMVAIPLLLFDAPLFGIDCRLVRDLADLPGGGADRVVDVLLPAPGLAAPARVDFDLTLLQTGRPYNPASAQHAGIAQLVERNLAKVEVASSRLVSRSKFQGKPGFPF